jgi:hypothetical protein
MEKMRIKKRIGLVLRFSLLQLVLLEAQYAAWDTERLAAEALKDF